MSNALSAGCETLLRDELQRGSYSVEAGERGKCEKKKRPEWERTPLHCNLSRLRER